MGKALKSIGIFLVSIILSGFIFWLVFLDKRSQDEVLEFSLNLLGDKLMAMVPDDSEKSAVKNLYDNFVQQAKAQQVAPEQVESVAATILNLSNLDTTLSSQQAETVLNYSLEVPLKVERLRERDSLRFAEADSVQSQPARHKRDAAGDYDRWDGLGVRLNEFYVLNNELQKALEETAQTLREKHVQMRFCIDNGLQVKLDQQVKAQLEQKQLVDLSKKLQRLEEKELLVWRKDLQLEMDKLAQELETLKNLEDLKKLEQLEQLGVLQSLDGLKVLDKLDFLPPAVKADSIEILVKRKLQEAGVPVDED